jgi:heterotetrameric sarcosine oxidase gamma subunit
VTAAAPVRRSPCAAVHEELGARTAETADWELVLDYGDVAAERRHVAEAVGLADVTARAKVDIRGEIPPGVAEAGGRAVAWLATDWSLVLGEPGTEEAILSALALSTATATTVTDVTHGYAGFALAGPEIPEAIERLSAWDVRTLRRGGATAAQIADVRAIILRHAVAPVLELYVETSLARYVFSTLLDVVARLGGGPVGRHVLHEQGWR